MVNTKNLISHFGRAGLRLEIMKRPLRSGRGMENILQIDIQRKLNGSQRGEWVRMYIPPQGATVQVRDTDPKRKQLVLLVKESAEEFEETIEYSNLFNGPDMKAWVSQLKSGGANIVRQVLRPKAKGVRPHVVVKRKTEVTPRCFLLGEDERQLFIAQLNSTSITSVQQAHENLGRTVQFAEGKRRGSSIDRQGEWFFLETTQATRDHIDGLIKKNKIAVNKKASIGQFMRRTGQPHRADELVVLGGDRVANKLDHGSAVRPTQVYIRGAVRHPDHKTQKFHQWREVVGNNEGATSRGGAGGVFWVD